MATKYRDRLRTRSQQPAPARPATPAGAPEISLQPDQPARDNGAREDVIRTRAYFLWEQAGRPEGDGAHFWYEAEREVGNDG